MIQIIEGPDHIVKWKLIYNKKEFETEQKCVSKSLYQYVKKACFNKLGHEQMIA